MSDPLTNVPHLYSLLRGEVAHPLMELRCMAARRRSVMVESEHHTRGIPYAPSPHCREVIHGHGSRAVRPQRAVHRAHHDLISRRGAPGSVRENLFANRLGSVAKRHHYAAYTDL